MATWTFYFVSVININCTVCLYYSDSDSDEGGDPEKKKMQTKLSGKYITT